jgi:hypothetical protein
MTTEPQAITQLRQCVTEKRPPLASLTMEAVLAAYDALQAAATPTPPRRLREYRGVEYTPDTKLWWSPSKQSVASSAAEAVCKFDGFTDSDHAAILALRDDPYLPVPTLEPILQDALAHAFAAGRHEVLHWQGTKSLAASTADTITRAFPHLDAPRALTAGECVARLCELGAREEMLNVNRLDMRAEFKRCLILPADTERAP